MATWLDVFKVPQGLSFLKTWFWRYASPERATWRCHDFCCCGLALVTKSSIATSRAWGQTFLSKVKRGFDTHPLQHTVTHCNIMQLTAQHIATHCSTLQLTATHCNTQQHAATRCSMLQHAATHCNTLQHTATHCDTLQHTATHSLLCHVSWASEHEVPTAPTATLTECPGRMLLTPWAGTDDSGARFNHDRVTLCDRPR